MSNVVKAGLGIGAAVILLLGFRRVSAEPPPAQPPIPPPAVELPSTCFVIQFANGTPDKRFVLLDADFAILLERLPLGATLFSEEDCDEIPMDLMMVLDEIELIVNPPPPPPPIELASECFVVSFDNGAPDKRYILTDAEFAMFLNQIPQGASIISQEDCSDIPGMNLNETLDDINLILNPELASETFTIIFSNGAPNKTYVLTDAEFNMFLTQIPAGAMIVMGSVADSDLPSDGLQFVLDDINLILTPGPVPASVGDITNAFRALSGTSTGADGRRIGGTITNLTDKEIRLTFSIRTIGPSGAITNNQSREVSLMPMEARLEVFDDFFTEGRPRGLNYDSTLFWRIPGTSIDLLPPQRSRFIFR